MIVTRRQFVGHLSAGAAVVAMSLTQEGCNAVTDLEAWIPVALTAVSGIVSLLGPVVPAPVAATVLLITQGFNALLTALKAYVPGTGVLTDIQNAFTAIETAFASFFASLSVPAKLLAIIEGLGQLLLSTLMAFAGKIIPASSMTLKVSGQSIPVIPVSRSIRTFKKQWDAYCTANNLPATVQI